MTLKIFLIGSIMFLASALFTARGDNPADSGGLGSLDPAALDPTIYKPVPEKWNEKNRAWQGVASIEATSNDRLWAVWYSGGAFGAGPDNYVLLATSGDGGFTWSKPFMALDRDDRIRLFDPEIWRSPDGRLWLFWAQSESTFRPGASRFEIEWDGRHGVWAMYTENPEAGEDAEWSFPRRLCDGVMMNKPIADKEGRWLYPVALWNAGKAYYNLPKEMHGANVYVSTDGGDSLRYLGGTDRGGLATLANEHNLIELDNGRLWLVSRIDDGIGEAFSDDGGKTWTEMTKTPYKQSSSRTQTRRLISGNILFLKNGPIEGVDGKDVGRSQMMAFLSEDGGKTWIGGLTLDPRDGVSHPDFGQTPDGTIYMIWDHDRGGSGEIMFARFTEDDVRAGKFVSEKALPAKAVNRLEK
ncbi:MAG: exo-alpha-sialidase [Thermoguttaceae bacterium]|nr:exo-alpha-sialidase [Thermoguttaceae bacterium]